MDIRDFDRRLAAFVEYFAHELGLPPEIIWGAVLCRANDHVRAVERELEIERARRPQRHSG